MVLATEIAALDQTGKCMGLDEALPLSLDLELNAVVDEFFFCVEEGGEPAVGAPVIDFVRVAGADELLALGA